MAFGLHDYHVGASFAVLIHGRRQAGYTNLRKRGDHKEGLERRKR